MFFYLMKTKFDPVSSREIRDNQLILNLQLNNSGGCCQTTGGKTGMRVWLKRQLHTMGYQWPIGWDSRVIWLEGDAINVVKAIDNSAVGSSPIYLIYDDIG